MDADEKLKAIGQVAREGRVRMRSPDEALADIERIIASEELHPPKPAGPEVLGEPAIRADLRHAA